jgi:hypothetical protein
MGNETPVTSTVPRSPLGIASTVGLNVSLIVVH